MPIDFMGSGLKLQVPGTQLDKLCYFGSRFHFMTFSLAMAA